MAKGSSFASDLSAPLADDRVATRCQRGGHELYYDPRFWGRTGFDLKSEARAACRGWFVGLVKNRAKINKRRSRRSRSRGLIDRDVSAATPAGGGNVDSRLAGGRSDRA